MTLTKALVRELFDYADGHLLNKSVTLRNSRAKVGEKAGYRAANNRALAVGINGKTYLLHRVIFLWHNGWLPRIIDHANRDPFDNRIENLRTATYSENLANARISSRNSSGYRGVSSHGGKWKASLKFEGTSFYLGLWNSKEEAARAYDAKRSELSGEYAHTNTK